MLFKRVAFDASVESHLADMVLACTAWCCAFQVGQIRPLRHTSLPASTTNTSHHSRVTVCLTDSVDLETLSNDFLWLSACEKAGNRDFAFVGAVEISSLRLRLRSYNINHKNSHHTH